MGSSFVYRSVGLRTRQSVFWLSVALAFVMVNVTVLADLSAARTALQLAWVVGVFLGTYRILSMLEKAEKDLGEGAEPDGGMLLAFNCASMLPVAGYLPFLVFAVR